MAEVKGGEYVTIVLRRMDLESIVVKAKSRPDMHSHSCPHFTWWGGECNCWVSQARKTLEVQGSKA